MGFPCAEASKLTEWLLTPLTVACRSVDNTDKVPCPAT